MPHKRNPVAAASALAAATMAPNLAATIFAAQVQDHERSAGAWHAEWPTLPTLMLVTSGALAAIVDIAEGLDVDAARMRANLDATSRLIMAEAVTMALAEKIGKSDAHHLIEAASKKAVADKKHLRDVLTADAKITAQLDAGKIAKLFEPMAYQGASQALIDRLLASLTKMSLPGSPGNPSLKEFLWMRGSSPRMTESHADDRRRRVPAQRIRRRPRRRTDADAVEFAGRDHADVGAADEGAHAGVPRHPLRPARPRQVERAARALFNGALRPRRAGDPRRPQYLEDALVRPVDGRHGRTMARRQCA